MITVSSQRQDSTLNMVSEKASVYKTVQLLITSGMTTYTSGTTTYNQWYDYL